MNMELAIVPPAVTYSPGEIRRHTDSQLAVIEVFLLRHPEYAKLPPDVLLQYAETYRDMKDHTLEQEFRDNGVIAGARGDYTRPETPDWDADPVHFSDNEAFQ